MNNILYSLFIIVWIILGYKIGNLIIQNILPKLAEKRVKEIEKNPKWITPKLREEYYGFDDIDIILAQSSYPILPFFRLAKNNRFELLVPDDITTKDVNLISQLALAGKIKIKYNVLYLDKPVDWLSILCYMLDGGDIIIK